MRRNRSISPLCRPAGWVAQWRKIGLTSVQNEVAEPY